MRTIRRFLVFEAVTFLVAALIHFGVLLPGYQHREAGIAESVIAGVLVLGLIMSWSRPIATPRTGLAVQGFALFGTLIGIFTIVVGVRPRTIADVVYHVGIVIVLVWGLSVARRQKQVSIQAIEALKRINPTQVCKLAAARLRVSLSSILIGPAPW